VSLPLIQHRAIKTCGAGLHPSVLDEKLYRMKRCNSKLCSVQV